MMKVRVIAPVPGGAPAWVHRAWVGCVLPVARVVTPDNPATGYHAQTGLVSRHRYGYLVPAAAARYRYLLGA